MGFLRYAIEYYTWVCVYDGCTENECHVTGSCQLSSSLSVNHRRVNIHEGHTAGIESVRVDRVS